ncbi:amidohydrolase family protein [Nocardia acidivorans]|uniref:amidohydrolase family protein n=1 Tax=Nocardia acidivorans TaxID=404580 RepID=UPI000A06BA3B|nr:amidohydrolase family protein [Nocardia acidivorans]
MKVIAIEEAFAHPALAGERKTFGGNDSYHARVRRGLDDVGAGRLAAMDAAGIDMQVLSHTTPGAEALAPRQAIPAARAANDALADIVAAQPDRFAGFAALPMRDPEAAAAELERAVRTLGFRGALINGTVQNRFLDDPRFAPVLAVAAELGVPIYLHPALPPRRVAEIYYGGMDPAIGECLASSAWGWHSETGLHVLRLIASGTLDRYRNLQLIIGHMGEMIPFMLARIDKMLTSIARELRQPFGEYFQTNVHITTSGYMTVEPLRLALEVLGADRIMFAVDYPYFPNEPVRALLDSPLLSVPEREAIASGNARKLLGL